MRESTKLLFSDLYDLHLAGVAMDTRIIVDDGELAIHWPLLLLCRALYFVFKIDIFP